MAREEKESRSSRDAQTDREGPGSSAQTGGMFAMLPHRGWLAKALWHR